MTKLEAVKKFVAVRPEEEDDRQLAEDDRQDAKVARLDVVAGPLPQPALFVRVCVGETDAGRGDVDVRAHWTTSAPVATMPATLVGIPAVIACTTSCCVVLSRS